ncbi:MAG: glycosyltransferase family 2 protein [Candidatus Omnitrophota bacterium]
MLKLIFWLFSGLMLYTYLGYPLLLMILAGFKSRPVKKALITPSLSFVIAAHNEEMVIADKICNTLSLDYPQDKLELIIVSDGSDDNTNSIIKNFRDEKIRFFHYAQRKGKPFALNLAVSEAKGDILIFSDANVSYDKDALRNLARNFNDESVGCVCGDVLIKARGSSVNKAIIYYSRYDRWLRQKEGLINTMLGADGAMYALRRALYSEIPANTIADDLLISMGAAEKGYRTVYEEDARGVEYTALTFNEELKRKARVVAGGFQALRFLKVALNPFLRKMLFFQFISHKLLRWIAPLLILSIAVLNIAILRVDKGIYLISLTLQVCFYLAALLGMFFKLISGKGKGIFYIPYYFCTTNLAAIVGICGLFIKKQTVTWKKAAR